MEIFFSLVFAGIAIVPTGNELPDTSLPFLPPKITVLMMMMTQTTRFSSLVEEVIIYWIARGVLSYHRPQSLTDEYANQSNSVECSADFPEEALGRVVHFSLALRILFYRDLICMSKCNSISRITSHRHPPPHLRMTRFIQLPGLRIAQAQVILFQR